MTLLPHTKALLATDPAVGFAIFDFASGDNVPANSTIYPISGQKANCWSAFSPKTSNVYLIDAGTSIVTEVNVDQTLKATVVNQYPLGANSGTIDSTVASVGNNE